MYSEIFTPDKKMKKRDTECCFKKKKISDVESKPNCNLLL